MALTGNRLGSRAKYQYTSDVGIDYVLNVDPDLAPAGTGLVAGNVGTTHPIGFKPRGVHVQLIEAGKIYRKFIICGKPDASLYASNTPQIVNIDGVAFTTTGRRGEVQRFL